MAIGREIRKRRLIAELGQDQFAKKLGLSQASVTGYERGAVKPSFDALMTICAVLGCTPNDLCADEVEAARAKLANP